MASLWVGKKKKKLYKTYAVYMLAPDNNVICKVWLIPCVCIKRLQVQYHVISILM